MRLKTRVLILIAASLVSLVAMGMFGLYSMKQSMMAERHSQITLLLDTAQAQLNYYYGQEQLGKINRQEAQKRALESLSAQKSKDSYYAVREYDTNLVLTHGDPTLVGAISKGGQTPAGQYSVDVIKEEITKDINEDGTGFVTIYAARPNVPDKTILFPKMEGASVFKPWNLLVTTGFFVDDIDTTFWKQSRIFLVAGLLLTAVLAALVFHMRLVILKQLGGEPHDAAEMMKRIASGDLDVNIELATGDTNSLMASLKMMQLKLSNLTYSIQENASSLVDQVSNFDSVVKTYLVSKSVDDLISLDRSIKKLGKTVDVLVKSIARFKL